MPQGFAEWGATRRDWKPNTQDKYRYWVDRADRWLRSNHNVTVERARTEHLEAWWDTLPPTASTRNQARGALTAYYSYLIDLGRRANNPASPLPRMRRAKSLPDVLEVAQRDKVLVAAAAEGLRWECFLSVIFYAGLRRDETRTLKWTAWEPGYLKVTGKGSKDRVVPVHRKLSDVLAAWQQACSDRVWMFPSPKKPGPMSKSWVHLKLKEIGAASDVPDLHPHLGRHTFATLLREAGADISEIRDLLGHESVATTQIYAHVRPVHLRQAVDRLE